MEKLPEIVAILPHLAYSHLRIALQCLDVLGFKHSAVHAETALHALEAELAAKLDLHSAGGDFSVLDAMVEEMLGKSKTNS